MKKLLKWLDKYFLFLGTAFLLFFIPLYPKLPLLDVRHTWVYIRLEDILVALLVGFWLLQLIRKKVSLRTRLTIPILAYWLAGGLSLFYILFFLGKHLAVFYPSVAILHFMRRIEYMCLFFVAVATIKDIKIVKKYLAVMAVTLLLVILYGLGQRFLGFPAFLTMNEEFAKGIPLYLPPGARISSTFAGHYDLGAYLILMITLFVSLIFAFEKKILKMGLIVLVIMAYFLLLLTASRISFAVYLLAIALVFWLQRKKWLIIPVVILSLLSMNWLSGASARLEKTFRVREVVYDARTGKPLAVLEEADQVGKVFTEDEEVAGEELPTGTGFLDIPLIQKAPPVATQAAVVKRPVAEALKTATRSSEIATISGEFLIKRTIVYDISFTTRFQGEWPRAWEAFRRNIILGSGFSSISLATDNDYLRLLGETGLLGFLSFLSIFAVLGLLLKKALAKINQPLPRSFFIGTAAGIIGLLLNAVLIDVFEASKVAFVLWLFLGIVVGLYQLLLPREKSLREEAGLLINSSWFPLVLILTVGSLLFAVGLENYFVADDFTWLRWSFTSTVKDIPSFFLETGGFFYRPLTKIYFLLVQPFFGLKPGAYHLLSLLLHLSCTLTSYLIVWRLAKSKLVASLSALFFLVHPLVSETVFWIASTTHLLANFFYLGGFLVYLLAREKQGRPYWLYWSLLFLAFLLGLASHERMITFPLILVFTELLFPRKLKSKWSFWLVNYLPLFLVVPGYLWLRNTLAQAHWLSGDYNYNWLNLPLNFLGNLFGYLGELVVGLGFVPVYDWARGYLQIRVKLAFGIIFLLGLLVVVLWQRLKRTEFWQQQGRLIVFGLGWLLIVLLPFLGLGNIAERYLYPAHLGYFLILALFLNWFYQRLKACCPKTALVLFLLLSLTLLGFYSWQTIKAEADWQRAGETTNSTLLSLASTYPDFGFNNQLYFVGLPLRYGRAWVFPVGLKDGLWFIYPDEELKVDQLASKEEGIKTFEANPGVHVFVWEDEQLKEIQKPEE